MDRLEEIELLDCPCCHGTGVLEEEYGWNLYVTCLDCGAHTAAVPYSSEEERLAVARRLASMWNVGKVIPAGPGE